MNKNLCLIYKDYIHPTNFSLLKMGLYLGWNITLRQIGREFYKEEEIPIKITIEEVENANL